MTKKSEPMRQSLVDMQFLLEGCARHSAESILRTPTKLMRRFQFSTTLSNPYGTSCIIRSENSRYRMEVFLGVETGVLDRLFPRTKDPGARMDAICEILNTVTGTFSGHAQFRHSFGEMPMAAALCVPGSTTIEDTWCIQGILAVNSIPLYFGAMLQPSGKGGDGG